MIGDIKFGETCWGPYSSYAYGASALYIPVYGEKNALEIILNVTQLYPEYKIHPVNDRFYDYHSGRERFESPYNMNIVGWRINLSENYWSYKYFIDSARKCYVLSEYKVDRNKNLLNKISIINRTKFHREFQFSYYVNPNEGTKFSKLELEDISEQLIKAELDNNIFSIGVNGSKFWSKRKIVSNNWLHFPLNPDNVCNNNKERLFVEFTPFKVSKESTQEIHAYFNMQFEKSGKTPVRYFPPPIEWKKFPADEINEANIPFTHLFWETLHNQQYVKSFNKSRYVRRHIPAKQWGRFYLWDSGMAAVGTLEEDEDLFDEMCDATPDPKILGKKIYHGVGCFIPTVIFAYWEIFQKSCEKNWLTKYYPKMKSLFLYFVNYKPDKSKFDNKDGLVLAVANSIGWDDYPQKVYASGSPFTWSYKKTLPVNPGRKFIQAKPVASTSYAIRFAKILRLSALCLDNSADVDYYSSFIKKSEESLNIKMWDVGLKNYLWVDAKNEKIKIVGADSCFPLLSCSCKDDNQIQRLVDYITDSRKYWTEHGVTVVPKNSEYFRKGYWNANIWIPVQWFFWKAFLNIGETEIAKSLIDNVLALWEKAHRNSYNCWEHFDISQGDGLGNSRFSGLSAPILSLYASSRQFGRFQTSQDVIIKSKTLDKNGDGAEIQLHSPFHGGKIGLSFVLKSNNRYRIIMEDNSQEIEVNTDSYGHGLVNLYCKAGKTSEIKIKSIEK